MTTTTTTNYGWVIPNDSELVTNGAAAIRTLGSSADASLKTVSDAAVAKSIVDAKGDLIAGTADNTVARVPVGADNQVLTADSTQAAGVKWSTPSSGVTTWTQRLNVTSLNSILTIAYNGSNLYVAGGAGGVLYTSPDGITWTSRTSGFGANNINGISYGNGLFVAVGANGTITTSSDGITWTARTAGVSTNALYDAKYFNSLWVAVGAGANGGTGGVTTSTDGITWTKRTTPTTTGSTLYSVAFGATYWWAVGDYSTSNNIYSTDGITWTVGTTLGSGSIRYITYQNSYFFTCDNATNSGSFYYKNTPVGTGAQISSNLYPSASGASKQFWNYNNKLQIAFRPMAAGNQSGINYLQTIDTAISGTQTVTYSVPISLPLGFDGQVNAVYQNATGYIIADNNYRIYTSF